MNEKIKFEVNKLLPVEPSARVCYLLGAGFSADTKFRFPLSTGFLAREFPYLEEDGSEEFANVELTMPELIPLFENIEREYGALEDLNLEAVMTDLYVRAFGIGRSWEPSTFAGGTQRPANELQRDTELLEHYIVGRLRLMNETTQVCPLANRLVRTLKRQDSIVTLNYDTIIESHLSKLPELGAEPRVRTMESTIRPPGSTTGGAAAPIFRGSVLPEHGVLAKLHGSVDWFTCPNPICPNHAYIQPNSPWSLIAFRGAGRPHCVSCGWTPRTVIIPPTLPKVFDRFPKVGLMWTHAYRALRHARRWVFMGISVASTDFHLSALLRASSRDAVGLFHDRDDGQLCIVDPDSKGVAKRVIASLAPDVARLFLEGKANVATFASIDEYLNAASDVDAARETRLTPIEIAAENIKS